MYYIFLVLTVFTVLLRPPKVCAYNAKARLAEWKVNETDQDDVLYVIKRMSEDENFTTFNHFSEARDRVRRLASFDSADQRKGN